MRGSRGPYNPYFTATYVESVTMRGNWMNAAGKERPQVSATGDVPFLPAHGDSPLESDDPFRVIPSRVNRCAFMRILVRRIA